MDILIKVTEEELQEARELMSNTEYIKTYSGFVIQWVNPEQ